MALADTAKLVASLTLDDKMSGGLKRASGNLGQFESRLGKIGGAASRGLGKAAQTIERIGILSAGAIAGGLAASIKLASDLNENINKTTVVFGKASDSVIAFSKTTASSLGLSQNEALGAAAAFGNMFKTTGLAEAEAADMSKTMVELAADMASFNNEDPTDMLDRLRSGLAGEAEPLRRFGVLLSEAAVKEEAYAAGIADRGAKLTEAQKVQARYSLILKQTTVQQGDFARTSKGLANQMRILRASFSNAGATIGTALLPKVTELVNKISAFLASPQAQAGLERFAKRLGETVGRLIDAIRLPKGTDIGRLFETAADYVDRIADVLLRIPWGVVADTFRTVGTFASLALDAFLKMPSWVQTAVITGWGLNKLTGGAVGDIVGELGKGLIKGVLGMNAGVVNINAATVNAAGGIPGAAAGAAGTAGRLGQILRVAVVGSVVVAGLATWLETMEGFAAENQQLKDQGLNAEEIAALRYYTASAADQATMAKRMGEIPDIADYRSAMEKLGQEIVAGQKPTVDALLDATAELKTQSHQGYLTSQAAQNLVDEARKGLQEQRRGEQNEGQRSVETQRRIDTLARVGERTEAAARAGKDQMARVYDAVERARSAINAQDLSVRVNNTVTVKATFSVRDSIRQAQITSRYGQTYGAGNAL
jgi:hypothetical protein